MKFCVGEIENCTFDDIATFLARVHPRQFQFVIDDMITCRVKGTFWTNNPYIVDCVPADRVVVFGQDRKPKLLSQHPDYERWKDEMTSGEFWATVGEDWEPVSQS